jgi:hypothetical protein
MRIAIVTAVWGRPEVFKLFAMGVHELEKIEGIDLITVVAGSEGEKSRTMVEAEGFVYIETPNQPLAEKHNKSVMKASLFNPDYIFCTGSDDLFHPNLFLHYIHWMKKGIDYIGVIDFYFYDLRTTRALYWGGYREDFRLGHTAGAGRAISKKVMDQWHWQPWEAKHNRVLDNSIQEKLAITKHTSHTF